MSIELSYVTRVVVTKPASFPAFIAHDAIDSVRIEASFPSRQFESVARALKPIVASLALTPIKDFQNIHLLLSTETLNNEPVKYAVAEHAESATCESTQ